MSPESNTPNACETAHPPRQTVRSAMASPRAHVRLWLCAVIGFGLDLWTKHKAFSTLDCNDVTPAIPNLLVLQKSINPGALFGMGSGLVWLFILASFVALAFVLYLFASSGANRKSLHVALGLILAGSLGNLYDRTFVTADRVTLKQSPTLQGRVLYGRITRRGSESILLSHCLEGDAPVQRIPLSEIDHIDRSGVVRDFLKFTPKFGDVEVWPWVFNLADSMLVAGVAVLLLNFWFERKHVAPPAQTEPATPTSDP